jgi:3-deoxy-D-manno-octulosonic-acid transferase
MANSIIYNSIFIPFGKIILKALSLFSAKIKDRESNIENSHLSLNKLTKGSKRIWFHSASMGEFEQAKPIIELIKERNPEIQIIASFFSPSGYNNQLKYKFADAIIYLPFDDKNAIRMLYDKIQPSALIIVRYEVWRNLLEIGNLRNIPIYLVAATFPRSLILNGIFQSFTKKNYEYFTKIFTFNDENYSLFEHFGLNNLVHSADPRFDRIIKTIENLDKSQFILKREFWKENEKIIVAGSTWEKDEDLLLKSIQEPEFKNLKLILVPHEPTEKHIKELTKKIKNFILYSEIENLDSATIKEKISGNILIIDKIGILLKLYSLADFAYVGGAFGVGVHSVTEPAGYGIPVLCGNIMTNSPDAVKMKELGGLGVIRDYESLFNYFKILLNDNSYYENISKINSNYIYQNKGESDKIFNQIIYKILN